MITHRHMLILISVKMAAVYACLVGMLVCR